MATPKASKSANVPQIIVLGSELRVSFGVVVDGHLTGHQEMVSQFTPLTATGFAKAMEQIDQERAKIQATLDSPLTLSE